MAKLHHILSVYGHHIYFTIDDTIVDDSAVYGYTDSTHTPVATHALNGMTNYLVSSHVQGKSINPDWIEAIVNSDTFNNLKQEARSILDTAIYFLEDIK